MKSKQALIIFVAVLASLLEIIDTSIVNVAIPTMMGNLGATLEDISMIITGYAIANAVILPLSGWLSEKLGRRKYYLGCIILFTVTSVACGLAPNLFTLTIFRILQGLAGGALLPTSQALIYEQFPKEKAGIAGAIFGMSVMIGPTLGPVMGGYLTDNFGWRSIFNINLPLGIIALFVGLNVIFDREKSEEEKSKQETGFDTVGLALLVAGIGCLQFVLERGEADDWFSSTAIVINAMIATLALPGFVWWELRVKNPIINIRLFMNKMVQSGVLLMSFLGFYLYGVVFLIPIFAGRVFHYDATQTGELFIPGSLLTAALMPFIGRRMQMGGNPKTMILIGFISIELSLYMMTMLSPLSGRSELLYILFMRGFALAFLFVPINSSILSQFKGQELGQVSGLLNLFRQIGGSTGVAAVGTLLAKNSHQNYLDLTSRVSLLNPMTQNFFFNNTQGLGGKMSDSVGMAENSQAALKALYYKIQNQVFMLSFNQLIWFIMIVVAFAIIPWYRLKLKPGKVAVVDAH